MKKIQVARWDDLQLLVSNMSYGALPGKTTVSLAQGAELAGIGIYAGEGACCWTVGIFSRTGKNRRQ